MLNRRKKRALTNESNAQFCKSEEMMRKEDELASKQAYRETYSIQSPDADVPPAGPCAIQSM